MAFFVNLPLSWVANEPALLDKFIDLSLQPEFGIDAGTVFGPGPDWHKRNLEKLRGAGLKCSVHLPFFDLHPGSENPHILEGTRTTLRLAARIARIYHPHHLVGHPIFNAGQHAVAGSPAVPSEAWLERSAATWKMVHEESGKALLCLENTHEKNPEPLVALLRRLDGKAGLCFDLGHWYSFAQGRRLRDLPRWLDAVAPYIAHMHLHDNKGDQDSHMGLGKGSIPFDPAFAELKERGIKPSFTLEPHSEDALRESLAFIAAHPEMEDVFAF